MKAHEAEFDRRQVVRLAFEQWKPMSWSGSAGRRTRRT
jgi:hypothetical protein